MGEKSVRLLGGWIVVEEDDGGGLSRDDFGLRIYCRLLKRLPESHSAIPLRSNRSNTDLMPCAAIGVHA